jgi:hypothetical protein
VLERGDDNRFSGDDLAEILLTAGESEAGMPGGDNTPSGLQDLTKTVMEQARTWNVCTGDVEPIQVLLVLERCHR